MTNGTLGIVEGIRATVKGSLMLRVRLDEANSLVKLDTATYGDLDYAYARTVDRAQGATVTQSFFLASAERMDVHLGLVAATRHQEQFKLYATEGDLELIEERLGVERLRVNAIEECIGPVHPALMAKLLGEYIEGSEQGDAVMRAFGVVPMEPGEESFVEGVDVGEQEILVVVDELLLDGAVESFAMGIHFRRARAGVPMRQVASDGGVVEVPGELAAVVGEDAAYGDGEHDLRTSQGQGGMGTGTGAEREGEAEAASQVDAGDEIPCQAVLAAFNGVSATQSPGLSGR
ncbi:hypothetical protein GCM10027066_06910 [Dyella jejuensis]